MNELIMLVGISGSGKSYFSDMARENGVKVFSSDEIREELWGDAADQQNPARVFEVLHSRLIRALKDGESCIYDATNLKASRRQDFLCELSHHGIECNKICIVMCVNEEECIKRDAARKRTVGKTVIRRQKKNLEMPEYKEGWDLIYLMKDPKNFWIKER